MLANHSLKQVYRRIVQATVAVALIIVDAGITFVCLVALGVDNLSPTWPVQEENGSISWLWYVMLIVPVRKENVHVCLSMCLSTGRFSPDIVCSEFC